MATVTAAGTAAIDEAVEVDHAACVARYVVMPGAVLERTDELQSLHSGRSSGFFNNAILLRWPTSDAADRLRVIVELARERGVPWRLYVTSVTTPSDLIEALPAAGLAPGIPGRSMLLQDPASVSAPAVDGLVIAPVLDDADLERWLAVRTASSGWDGATVVAWREACRSTGYRESAPIRAWVGSLAGKPVASVAVHLGDLRADGTRGAGIYHVETVPAARRRGIATALTAHAVSVAVTAGATRVVLSATDAAFSAYARLGFRAGGSFTYWYDPELGA